MHQTLLNVHSILRWGVLLLGLWTVLNALTGMSGKRAYSHSDNLSNLLFMIFCDLQLLFGLLLFFSGPWSDMLGSGMGDVMKNKMTRFFTVEHSSMMILAWVLVHIGRVKVKKAADDRKHRTMLIFFGITLLLILAMIPWPFRGPEIGRPIFPSL